MFKRVKVKRSDDGLVWEVRVHGKLLSTFVEHAFATAYAEYCQQFYMAADPGKCERCGSDKPVGQSCDCFDNGCQ